MKIEQIVFGPDPDVTLTAYLQDVGGEFAHVPKRPAILVLPGGGYHRCVELEAEPVALAYLQAGFQAFVLRYSVGAISWPQPLEDYEQAMALIRAKADEWNLYADKVAVIGFSAGGHLAACAATAAKNKPNAAVLGYPVTNAATAKFCLDSAPSVIEYVNPDTCPCFLFATRTDQLVPIVNTIDFSKALEQNGVAFESHIYAYGPHGFSTADPGIIEPGTQITARAARWVQDSIGWLRDTLGDFGAGELAKPQYSTHNHDDFEPYCSVDCTTGHLLKNEKACAVLTSVIQTVQEKMIEHYGKEVVEVAAPKGVAALGDGITLRNALTFRKIPEAIIEELDQQLREIPNIRS